MSTAQVGNAAIYDPKKILDHPEFRVLSPGEKPPSSANIAAFYNPAHEIHLVEKPKPKPGPGQVLIHVRATGICGSDVHFWKHGQIGDSMIVTDECGSGHESAGEIVEVGEGVTEWKAGDRVAMEVGVPCSLPSCDACRTGRYNGCPDVVFFSTPPYHGTLTRWHVHPAQWLHRLPDNVSFEEGSLYPVVICGAGPIVVSIFAKSLVPGVRTVLIDRNATPKEQAKVIKDIAGGPLQLALECTGVESSIHTAVFSVAFGGKVFIIGVGKNEQVFPFMHLSANEIDVQFQYRYANQYPKAIRLIAGGLINVKPLVTHRFSLEEAVSAFHVAADPTQGAIKVQIQD
ncbi:GroES-like protein [Gymnopus androsaceus JB14]|uniref:L-arabinitol 4-dehydrogenase n=1 Tax=Gymnopus androsaceus JB14 TaxID=1447944 RepID=A0A6A4HJK4_9AGAR|nr:GroES-like protein [Gymnopus androsaceus JB14]